MTKIMVNTHLNILTYLLKYNDLELLMTDNNVMSHLVTVTSHFLTVTLRDITLYVVNNHRIARTIIYNKKI